MGITLIGCASFLLGAFFGYYVCTLSEDTRKTLKDLREKYRAQRESLLSLRSISYSRRLEIYKLNKGLMRRTRQLQHLKSRMEKAGVPVHTPGTRPQKAAPPLDQAVAALSATASGSMDSVLRNQLSRATSAVGRESDHILD